MHEQLRFNFHTKKGGALETMPVSLKQANDFITLHHRHHAPLKFHKYSIGVAKDNRLVGICLVNRPVNPGMDDGYRLEVARLCTDGTKNACSFLLARAAAVAKNMGYHWIQTYTLAEESFSSYGGSMRAAGWLFLHVSKGGTWNTKRRKRVDKHPTGEKCLWVKALDERAWRDG